jgi:O-antigen ligase
VLWLIFIAGTMPYLENEVARTELGYLFAISIYVTVFLYFISDAYNAKNLLYQSYNVWRKSPHFVFYCFSILVSFAILIFFYNDDVKNYQIYKLVGYILLSILSYVAIPILVWPKRLKQLWNSLMLIGAVSALLGVLSLFTGVSSVFGIKLISYDKSPFFNIPSTAGPFFEINTYAVVLMFGLVGAYYFITKKQKMRLAVFSFLICTFALAFTWSRSMYIGVPILLLTSKFIGFNKKKRLWMIFGSLIGLAIAIALVFTVPVLRDLFQVDLGLTGRGQLWTAAVNSISDRPFSGYGLGGLEHIRNVMSNYAGVYHGYVLAPHNSFLEIGMQMGAISMLSFIAIFIISFIRLMRSEIDIFEKRAIGSGMVVACLGISTLTYSLGGISYISLVLGILWGLGNLSTTYVPSINKSS